MVRLRLASALDAEHALPGGRTLCTSARCAGRRRSASALSPPSMFASALTPRWCALEGCLVLSKHGLERALAAVQVYEPFFADFGPLNMGCVYRFCQTLLASIKVRQTASLSLGAACRDSAAAPPTQPARIAFCVPVRRHLRGSAQRAQPNCARSRALPPAPRPGTRCQIAACRCRAGGERSGEARIFPDERRRSAPQSQRLGAGKHPCRPRLARVASGGAFPPVLFFFLQQMCHECVPDWLLLRPVPEHERG